MDTFVRKMLDLQEYSKGLFNQCGSFNVGLPQLRATETRVCHIFNKTNNFQKITSLLLKYFSS